MAQDAHEHPVGPGRSYTPPPTSTGMWEPPARQMQTHAAAFPSWSPYAGTFVGVASTAFGAHLSPAAADTRLSSELLVPDHAWNHQATHTGSHGSSGYRENFLSLLEARNMTPEMFGDVPAAASCDYLTGLGAAADMAGAAAYGLGSVDGYSAAGVPPARHGTVEIQSALGCSGMGRSERERLTTASSFGVGSLPDAGLFCFSEFSSSTAEPMSIINNTHDQEARPGMASNSSSSSGSEPASVAMEKRKSEERVGRNTKKASRKASPPKPQAPKVKVGEKITALQQIVSPFGKTDTSSVLFETIKYIKFLHEQLRLVSEPYTTKSAYKGHARFGSEGEKEVAGAGSGCGLRGRGLCLVPVSLTSHVYHDDDDTPPDCWTPAYRSCLYYR